MILACSLFVGGCAREEEPTESVPSGTPVIVTTQTSETEAPGLMDTGSLHIRPAVEANGDIVILMTGDMHCGFDKNFSMGGLYEIRYQHELKGDTVILVDDGDAIQGEPIAYQTRGEIMIGLMNNMDYAVAIPGEHEFYYGMDRFFELVNKAKFDYVCCNFVKDGKQVLKPYVIKEVLGKKIAFVGVTTPKAITLAPAESFQDENGNYVYGFMQDETGDLISNAVQSAVDKARSEGADYVVLMGHIGNEEISSPWVYTTITSKVKGVDIYLDGYSHEFKVEEYIDAEGKKISRVPAGSKLNGVGWVRIPKDEGAITCGFYAYANKMKATDLFEIENPMTRRVDDVKKAYNMD
ncbi:MAG: hypothetical protein E7386_08060 [Ruminococcaceae bacterium]|nr:hypothetical protein [Oscillospiraceae bacterium]